MFLSSLDKICEMKEKTMEFWAHLKRCLNNAQINLSVRCIAINYLSVYWSELIYQPYSKQDDLDEEMN